MPTTRAEGAAAAVAMAPPSESSPRVAPVLLLHQEGLLALVAVVGLALRPGGPLRWLAPSGGLAGAVVTGVAAGGVLAGGLYVMRAVPPLARLERWQRGLVRGWSVTDAVAVAFLSGVAEEALIRALLQPLIGLLPAALVFSLLHLVPDRRLWLWPVLALGLGVALGGLYELAGYPAAAAAHVVLNAVALMRLRRDVRRP